MDKEIKALIAINAARTERMNALRNEVATREYELKQREQTIRMLKQENEAYRAEVAKLHSWLSDISESVKGAA